MTTNDMSNTLKRTCKYKSIPSTRAQMLHLRDLGWSEQAGSKKNAVVLPWGALFNMPTSTPNDTGAVKTWQTGQCERQCYIVTISSQPITALDEFFGGKSDKMSAIATQTNTGYIHVLYIPFLSCYTHTCTCKLNIRPRTPYLLRTTSFQAASSCSARDARLLAFDSESVVTVCSSDEHGSCISST